MDFGVSSDNCLEGTINNLCFPSGYFNTFTHLVFILLPVDTEASLVKLTQPGEEEDRFRSKVYTNPLYVRAALSIFPFLYRRGILDF